ncbi:MAG: hypothetical protein ABIJ96_05340 [Elusimicrobiota bacterium]
MRIYCAAVLFLFTFSRGVGAEEFSVAASSAAVKPRTVNDIYTGAHYRNPFTAVAIKSGGISFAAAAAWDPADFNIHELDLKGLLRDKNGAFAILTDRLAGVGFMLRKGKLYDYRNNLIPDVTGKINVAQKTVYLITSEKDVQTLHLGEDKDDSEQ